MLMAPPLEGTWTELVRRTEIGRRSHALPLRHSPVPGVPELHCAVVEVFLNQAGRDCGLTDSGRAALSASDAQQNLAFFRPPHPNRIRISGWRRAVSRNLKI
jgi:hypothetical protein